MPRIEHRPSSQIIDLSGPDAGNAARPFPPSSPAGLTRNEAVDLLAELTGLDLVVLGVAGMILAKRWGLWSDQHDPAVVERPVTTMQMADLIIGTKHSMGDSYRRRLASGSPPRPNEPC